MREYNKILFLVMLFMGLIPLFGILYFHPYFGLMDDWSNFFFVLPKIHAHGLLSISWEYAMQDLAWGMFRPVYPLMIWLLYQPAWTLGSTALFATNWAVVIGSTFILNKSLSRISGISVVYLFLGEFAWFHFHDLFQHPSLQEKLLFLFGGALLLQCHNFVSDQKLYRVPLILFFLIVGLASKASFCIFSVMALVILFGLLLERNLGLVAKIMLLIYPLLLFGGTFFLTKVARHGSYTQQNFSFQHVFTNLKTNTGIFLFCLIVSAVFVFCLDWRIKKWTKESILFLSLISGLSAFLAIFLPWGMGGYLDTDIAAIATALALFLVVKLVPRKYFLGFLSSLALLAFSITAYKAVTTNIRLSDLRFAVESVSLLKKENISQILVPCEEGSAAMRTYWQQSGWVGEVIRPDFSRELPKSGQVVFYDQGFCTLPNRAGSVAGCNQDDILPVRWSRSFHLVRLKNCKL